MLCEANILELHAAILCVIISTTCEKMCIRDRSRWCNTISIATAIPAEQVGVGYLGGRSTRWKARWSNVASLTHGFVC